MASASVYERGRIIRRIDLANEMQRQAAATAERLAAKDIADEAAYLAATDDPFDHGWSDWEEI